MIFLSLRFYVKSNLAFLESQKQPFSVDFEAVNIDFCKFQPTKMQDPIEMALFTHIDSLKLISRNMSVAMKMQPKLFS